MAVANEGLEKLEDMIVRQAEATGTTSKKVPDHGCGRGRDGEDF